MSGRRVRIDKIVNKAIRELDAAFVSPAAANNDEFEVALLVDEIGDAVTGGLAKFGISTTAVIEGRRLIDQVLVRYGENLTQRQIAALSHLKRMLR